jgi:hypothetical protein
MRLKALVSNIHFSGAALIEQPNDLLSGAMRRDAPNRVCSN